MYSIHSLEWCHDELRVYRQPIRLDIFLTNSRNMKIVDTIYALIIRIDNMH